MGTVQDVRGATVSVQLDEGTLAGLVFVHGRGYRIGQVGSFVRIGIGLIDLYGVISQAGAAAAPDRVALELPESRRWLSVELVGEGERIGGFGRGISQYPTVGDEAHLVTEDELALIYGSLDAPNFVRLGSLANAESIPALVEVNRLVNRHSTVVGATGAGKSTTVATIVNALSNPAAFPAARILIFDIHGEYRTAFGDRASVFRVGSPESDDETAMQLPYWALTFEEFLSVTPFGDLADSDRSALADKITLMKQASLAGQSRDGVNENTLTVDSPVPFSIHRLWYELHRLVRSTHTAQGANQSEVTEAIETNCEGNRILGDIMGVIPPKYQPITKGGTNRVYLSGSTLNIGRQLMAMQSRLRDSRYDFLFRPGAWCPKPELNDLDAQPDKDLDELLGAWIGAEKPIKILDLSGVPNSVLSVSVGVLVRLLFDALFWARRLPEGGRRRPLLFVFEEAHAYLDGGSAPEATRSIRRVIKEGRKYGIGAMIVSQRPAEIDPTILSQCGTTFALRLTNTLDRSHVTSAASDNLAGLFQMLPTLRTGEMIIAGEAVPLPLRTITDLPSEDRRPDSQDPKIYDSSTNGGWNRRVQSENYRNVVHNWRGENSTLNTDT